MTDFAYTGGTQSYVVPAGVNIVSVQVEGADGKNVGNIYYGRGGVIFSNHAVTPGETLTVVVGGKGGAAAGGYNGGGAGASGGGGGGGATDVRRGGTALANRIAVGGGGGGNQQQSDAGDNTGPGSGARPSGTAGKPTTGTSNYCGKGGTASAGGAAGGSGGTAGTLGVGGAGGTGSSMAGNGGGGGYYGGGGGGGASGFGYSTYGGGGSSFTSGTLVSDYTRSTNTANQNGLAVVAPYVTPAPFITAPVTGTTTANPAVSVNVAFADVPPLTGSKIRAEIQYANNSAFTGATTIQTALQSTNADVTQAITLPSQGVWYVRARTIGDSNIPNSAYSSTVTMTVAHKPVAAPTSPTGGAQVPYAATYGFKFTTSDSYSGDIVSAYRIMLYDPLNNIVKDTGKITVPTGGINGVQQALGAQAAQVSGIPTSVKGSSTRWTVQIWDKDDVASDAASATFIMQDPPTVSITNPPNLATVTSGTPLIQWNVSGPNSASHQSTTVVIRDVATGAVVWSTTLTGATTPVQAQPSSPVVANGKAYNVTVTYTSTTGMSGSATAQFSASYVVPDPVYYTVSVDSIDVNGSVTIDWSNTLPDVDLVRWNVYRRLMPLGNWEKIATVENVADTTFSDTLVPVGYTYMYNVTQTVLRFGVEVEGTVGQASGVVTVPPRINLSSNPSLTTNDNQWRAADVGTFVNYFGPTGVGTITRTNVSPLRMNLATDPATTVLNNTTGPALGLPGGRWFGGGGSATGTYSIVTGASDGPLPELTTYARKKWTVSPGSASLCGDTGVQTNSSTALLPNTTYTYSGWLRASINGMVAVPTFYINHSGGQTRTNEPVFIPLPAGHWVRISGAFTTPASFTSVSIALDTRTGDGTSFWQVGSTLDTTGLLVEAVGTQGAVQRTNLVTTPKSGQNMSFAGGTGVRTIITDTRWIGRAPAQGVWSAASTGQAYALMKSGMQFAVGEVWTISARYALSGGAAMAGILIGGAAPPTTVAEPVKLVDQGNGTLIASQTFTITGLGSGTGLGDILLALVPGAPATTVFIAGDFMAERATVAAGSLLRTNLCKYPNAEDTTITGWASASSATVTSSTDQAHSGTRSYKVVTPGVTTQEGINQYANTTGVATSGTTGLETVSIWVFAPAGATFVFIAEEYTPGGTYVAGRGQTLFTGTGTWQRVSTQGTKSVATNVLRSTVRTTAAQAITFYVDDALNEASGTLGAYFDGSTYPVSRTNLLINPSGRSTTAGLWTHQQGTGESSTITRITGTGPIPEITTYYKRVVTTPKTGGNSGIYTRNTGVQPGVAGAAGDTLTGSFYILPSVSISIVPTIGPRLAGVASGAALSGAAVTCPANVWTRLSVTGVTTMAYDDVQVWAVEQPAAILPAGGVINMTGVQVERAAVLGTYFDGDTPYVAPSGYAWQGAANGSVSNQLDMSAIPNWTGAINGSTSELRTAPVVPLNSYFDGTTQGTDGKTTVWTGTPDLSTSEWRLLSTGVLNDYFSGATPDTAAYDYQWTGTANASPSQMWDNRAGLALKKLWTTTEPTAARMPLGFIENGLGAGIYSALAWIGVSKKMSVRLNIEFADASDTFLGGKSTYGILAQPGSAGNWLSVQSATAPAGTDHIRVYIGNHEGTVVDPVTGETVDGKMSAGDWFAVDRALLIASDTVGPWTPDSANWFDGSVDTQVPPPNFTNEWLGVPNISRSRQYEMTWFQEYRTIDVYSDYFWIIGEQYPELSVRLPVAEQSETEEYESATYGIIGRGRHRDYGTRWGYTGSLTVKIRTDERISSTRKAVEALRQVQDTYWLRTPFGKLFKIAIGDLGWTPLAGVGGAEMGDLTIPYEEVG